MPEELRGTYAGLAHPASIDYLKALGVTAVELLPIHEMVDEGHLVERGLQSLLGLQHTRLFAPGGALQFEWRRVRAGARSSAADEGAACGSGSEVILDVVYNHTCEGNQLRVQMLSFKGICNTTYYRTTEDPRYYMDYTGTGNTAVMCAIRRC